MFIFNKKRIYIILTCLLVSTFVIQIKGIKKSDVKETVALPVNNKVIIIDAGHGGEDGGANTDDRCIRGRY